MRPVEATATQGPTATAQTNGGKARLPLRSLACSAQCRTGWWGSGQASPVCRLWNEDGIVQNTSHLLSQGKKEPLRTWPPAFPQKLVASLAGIWPPGAHHLAGQAGKHRWQKQRAGTSWKPLVHCPGPGQCSTSRVQLLTLRPLNGHQGRCPHPLPAPGRSWVTDGPHCGPHRLVHWRRGQGHL